jgi:hypothetical protein
MDESKSVRRVTLTIDRQIRTVRIYGIAGIESGQPCPVCGRLLESHPEATASDREPGPELDTKIGKPK